jgi:hypothetical protein
MLVDDLLTFQIPAPTQELITLPIWENSINKFRKSENPILVYFIESYKIYKFVNFKEGNNQSTANPAKKLGKKL